MNVPGVALVTGASRGIGRAVALELARRGFDTVATMRNPADGATLADELPDDAKGSLRVERLDVTDPDSIAVPSGLQVLINNAGVEGENLSVEHTPLEEWRRQFEPNVFGLVEVTRQCLPEIRRRPGGVIVNVTSSSLVVPMPFFSVYRAAKAAVSALSESLRAEVAPFGLHVMEVMPGPVDTDMLTASKHTPEAERYDAYTALAERVAALRRKEPIATVDHVARVMVSALCADPPPHRLACDPMGAELLDGWSTTPDVAWQGTFLGAFALPDDPPRPNRSLFSPHARTVPPSFE